MKKMIIAFGVLLLAASCGDKTETKEPSKDAAEKPATEIGDDKLMDVGKNGLANLSKGDIATWMNDFADDAKYFWNNGDSLAGKKAISDYWTDRRTNVIDSITFAKEIWLPIKVNKPQNDNVAPGTWLLGWYMTNAKYKKTGKRMIQWIHATIHFNDAGKIDRYIQYLDREPINKAMTP